MSRSPEAPNEVLCGDLGWLLDRAGAAYSARLREALAETGRAQRTQCVLAAAMDAGHTQIELAHAVGMDKTTMVATIDVLERDGLAVRTPAPRDRRARVIEVTDRGRKAYDEGRAIARRVQEEILDELSPRERAHFLVGLRYLVEQGTGRPLDADPPAAAPAPAGSTGAAPGEPVAVGSS